MKGLPSLLLLSVLIIAGVAFVCAIHVLNTVGVNGLSAVIIVGVTFCGTLIAQYFAAKRAARVQKPPNNLTHDQQRSYDTWVKRLLPVSLNLISGGLVLLVFFPSQRALWVPMAVVSWSIILGLDWYFRHLSRRNRNERR